MSNERSKSETNTNDIEWNAENEIKLFYAMRGHKPVGVSKNFHMISILDEFSKLTEKDISSKVIWNRLDQLYDMETLHDNEDLPFPTLPDSVFTIEGIPEFEEFISKKNGNDSIKSDKDIENKEEIETNANSSKTANKSKTQDLTKSNTKIKTENEKILKSERKEDVIKVDKSDDIEDKSNRSKKQMPKSMSETRSATHNTPSSNKKRK